MEEISGLYNSDHVDSWTQLKLLSKGFDPVYGRVIVGFFGFLLLFLLIPLEGEILVSWELVLLRQNFTLLVLKPRMH